jgi:endo-1,4-beta-xylanase
MPDTQWARRRGIAAAGLALAATLLAVYLVLDRDPPPEQGKPVSLPGQTGTLPSRKPPESAVPRVLTVQYTVSDRWKGGFTAHLRITNIGSQPVEGWLVNLRLPSGVKVIQAWSANVTQSATAVTLRSQPWNTYLGPGAAINFGFQATGSAVLPDSCTVNHAPC